MRNQNDENISTHDYQDAQNVWSKFKCKAIKDYHDLYGLTQMFYFWSFRVFENFREPCLEH